MPPMSDARTGSGTPAGIPQPPHNPPVVLIKPGRLLRYLWPAPYTVLGLLLGTVALVFGAKWRRHHGVMEIFGGRVGGAISRLPPALGFSAMTLGHVILAV